MTVNLDSVPCSHACPDLIGDRNGHKQIRCHCEEQSDEAIHACACCDMDCFACARNDDPASRRLLTMWMGHGQGPSVSHTMESAVRVSKWGDSLAVRLPKALIEKMGLRAGDELSIVDATERALIVQREDRRKAALERLGALDWTLPPDYKFDRDEANQR